MHHPKDFRCRYCRERFPIDLRTRDHVVPQWVIRLFRVEFGYPLTDKHEKNIVSACPNCNHRKKCLPAAEFLRVRNDPDAYSQAIQKWSEIAAKMSAPYRPGCYADRQPIRLEILKAYREPLGGE